jgi:hypothetical protein
MPFAMHELAVITSSIDARAAVSLGKSRFGGFSSHYSNSLKHRYVTHLCICCVGMEGEALYGHWISCRSIISKRVFFDGRVSEMHCTGLLSSVARLLHHVTTCASKLVATQTYRKLS